MRKRLIQTAAGKRAADLVLKNAKVLNIFTGEIVDDDIAVIGGYIAGLGSYSDAHELVDLQGQYVVPGFINAHCHVESSMVMPDIYCKEELRHGTTTLITDPHEIANVAGIDGVLFMIESADAMPVNYYVQAPSCVPATGFEHSGATLGAAEIAVLLQNPRILGLGEMMDYPGVLSCGKTVMEKLALADGRVVDGHSPLLSGLELQAYAVAGISTDHESTSFEEAREKLRTGLAVLVREGSACKDLAPIISGVVRERICTRRMAFCTDDKNIADIRREGTIRNCVRKAIDLGLSIAEAYSMASYNAAQIYRLYNLGVVAAGFKADIVVVEDLNKVDVKRVYKDGKLIDCDSLGRSVRINGAGKNSVRIAELPEECFKLPEKDVYPVIEAQKKQIVTKKRMLTAEEAMCGLRIGELCKIAVIERHHATGNIGLGILSGYGLKNGAIATTVGHDSHNLIVVGTNDSDMELAVNKIKAMQGGYVLVQNGETVGTVPLSAYGLMSVDEPESFIKNLERLAAKAHEAGVHADVEPFITLSFMALPVIPEIRVTDMGIFDVGSLKFIE